MRSGTRSQCKLASASVMRSERISWTIIRADALRTDWRRRTRSAGRPTSTPLLRCRNLVATELKSYHQCLERSALHKPANMSQLAKQVLRWYTTSARHGSLYLSSHAQVGDDEDIYISNKTQINLNEMRVTVTDGEMRRHEMMWMDTNNSMKLR